MQDLLIAAHDDNEITCLEAFCSDLLGANWIYRFFNALRRRRKQLFIGFLFLFAVGSVVYYFYLFSFLRAQKTEGLEFKRKYWWELVISHMFSTNSTEYTELQTCKNTNQGRIRVTDEQGYTCTRDNLEISLEGCCRPESSKRYSCENCSDGCCEEYEICVSCCLTPEHYYLQDRLLKYLPNNENIEDESLFEFCSALCRTSSKSILPDHSFIQPNRRFCYI